MRITLGITGSIAAYKACELVRLLVKDGDEVRVMMTDAAQDFVTPLTFATLSKHRVATNMFAEPDDRKVAHIALADADRVVVAPASADMIAKAANGIADDIVAATLLATRAQIVMAPAMNDGMWENAATQENIAKLKARGVRFVEPDDGELACGTAGRGRLAEVGKIYEAIRN